MVKFSPSVHKALGLITSTAKVSSKINSKKGRYLLAKPAYLHSIPQCPDRAAHVSAVHLQRRGPCAFILTLSLPVSLFVSACLSLFPK